MMSINSIFVPLLANCFRQVEAVYKQKYTPTVPLQPTLRGEEKQTRKDKHGKHPPINLVTTACMHGF